MKNILILEDDVNLGFLLQEHLRMNGFTATLCNNGVEGLNLSRGEKFSMFLVDIMMPKMDGFSFISELRKTDTVTPVIFLTARSLNEDRIEGFKRGCDDYVTKPFSMEELLLRMHAIFRRAGTESAGEPEPAFFKIGLFTFYPEKQLLTGKNKKCELTTRESELLRLLCLHKNTALEREKALKIIWGNDSYFSARSMDVFIVRLRKLLKADPAVAIINIHGKGYKLIDNE